jgi:polyisoprenoid-binding protein YceI
VRKFASIVLAALSICGLAAADDYMIDPVHSAISFKISHVGLSYVHGRFDSFSGDFTIDSGDPSKSSFRLKISPESVDTNNKGRDNHLRSPDFFNVKQFPVMSFASTAVKPVDGGYEVTGDLTLHGQTKPVTLTLKGGTSAEFPKGVQRTGYVADFVVKRSDFGVGKMAMLGDEVYVSVGIEGTKK